LACNGSKTRITPEDIANSARKLRCGSCSTGKLPTRIGNVRFCQMSFTNYSDIVPDHIDPRGMGGARRDDHPDNIQAVHFWCNGEKGSTREY
jgi:hypothetical protein